MKKYSLFCAALLVASFTQVTAQDVPGLAAKLQQSVTSVQTGSRSYEQKMTFTAPATIKYSYDEIDQKGNKTNRAFEFNLADLDPYAVREQTQKDLISVVLTVKNKQKLIKEFKNEQVEGYTEQAQIISKDIENARAISDVVKKAIAPAEKAMAGKLKLSGYDAMVSWLTGNVKNVTLTNEAINQTLGKAERPGSLKFTQLETNGKNSKEDVMVFNLADINPNTINFKISTNRFAVRLETLRDEKFISVRSNGEVKPYTNDLLIYTNSVDEARDLKTVLGLAIPLAIDKVKADIPAPATDKDALQKLKTLTTEVATGNKQISQTVEAQCLCQLTQIEKDPKTTEKNVYKFNWIDVNPAATKIGVTGDRLFIDVNMNDGKKLVMHTKDEKFMGYDNELKMFFPDVENARRAKVAIDKAVEKCKAGYKEPFGNDAASVNNWIKGAIKDVTLDQTTVKQTLEPVEAGKNNTLKFTRTEVTSKGGSEEVYEFNLSDMNPLAIDIEVKGNWLYVTVQTDFKSKIIKYYKNGKIQPYLNSVEFAINDIDVSRNLVSALKKSIAAVKSK